jgi:putative heme-binding domain-containing protein
MASRGGESLLYNILVPNAEIDPRYAAVTIVTVDGRVVTGIIAAESGSSVTLKGAKGELTTVLRVDIDELLRSGTSLMPEGFEKSLDKTAMANLLAYLQASTQTSGTQE